MARLVGFPRSRKRGWSPRRSYRSAKADAKAGLVVFVLVLGGIGAVGNALTGGDSHPSPAPESVSVVANTTSTIPTTHRSGRASVIDGDTIEIHGERIRFHGVDAPESGQTCNDADGDKWRCGQKAAYELSDKLGARTVSCEKTDTDRYGRTVAKCSVGGEDIGKWLVSNGWARAFTRYSGDYAGEELEAKDAKLGIWRGEHVAPWDYRAGGRAKTSTPSAPVQLMDSGSQTSGCAIKGNLNKHGECIYHVPGSRYYSRTKISPSKGEQYFCTIAEAVAAGCRAPRG